MPSSEVSYRPSCWRVGRRVPVRMELLGASFAVFFVVGFVATIVSFDVPLSSRLIAGWMASLFLGALLFPLGDRVFSGRGASALVPHHGATRVHHTPHEVPALVVVCFVGAAFGAGVIWTALDTGFVPGAVVGALIAAYFLYYPLLIALRRLRRGWLDLSPTTITMRGWGYTATVRWDDVVGVEPRGEDPVIALQVRLIEDVHVVKHVRWARIDWPVARRAEKPPSPGVPRPTSCTGLIIPMDRFAIDPALLYGLMNTYWVRPTLRHELGTPAATARAATLMIVRHVSL